MKGNGIYREGKYSSYYFVELPFEKEEWDDDREDSSKIRERVKVDNRLVP